MAAFVAAIGLGGLIGWKADIPGLHSWTAWTGWEAPGGAVAMLVCGACLWLQVPEVIPPWRRRVALGLSIITGALALMACIEEWFGVELTIDDLFFKIGLQKEIGDMPGNGASITLLCACVSFVLFRTRSLPALCVSTVGTSGCLILSLTAVFGFSLGVDPGSPFWRIFGMSIQTALAFLVLGGGLIAGRPDRPLIATISSPHAGGVMARRILPVAIGLPLLLAGIQLVSERVGNASPSASVALRVSLFVSVQTIVVLISAYALNRTDNKRREAEESRRLMLDELDHRVKNTLASVVAMCEQTLGSVKSMEEFRAAFIGRVHAMARAHEALASRRWDGVSIRELVETTMAPFATSGRSSFRLDGDEAVLPAAAAVPVAATLHELATNAAKHGALSESGGGISVEWSRPADGGMDIRWTERSPKRTGARSAPVHSGGFGTTLIRGLVAHELKGSTDLEIDDEGVRCRIHVPAGAAGHGSGVAT
jgi:two-component sensor histidine kinase